MGRVVRWTVGMVLGVGLTGCGAEAARAPAAAANAGNSVPAVAAKLAQYTPVRLNADLERLSDRERRMIPLLIEAAQEMDTIYWQQVYASRDSLLATIAPIWLLLHYLVF